MHIITPLMQELAESQIKDLGLKDKDVSEVDSLLEDYLDESKYTVIDITYYGEPKAQARARASSNLNHFYDPSKSIKLSIGEAIRSQLGHNFKPINSEIFFTARYYKPFPKSTPKKKQVLMELGVIRPVNKPDLDNYEKLLYDALLNVLYLDDSVVVYGNHQKFYSCKPRVEISIKFRNRE